MIPFSALAYKWIFAKISGLRYVEYFYIGVFISIVSLALVGLGAVLTFPFHFTEDTTVFYLFSGIRILITILIEAAILRSLLGITWIRAVFSTLAGNAIGYVLLVFLGSLLLLLITRI